MIREVCNNLGILCGYFTEAEIFTPDLKECCVESGIALLNFFSDTVYFLRNDMPRGHSTNCKLPTYLAYSILGFISYYIIF